MFDLYKDLIIDHGMNPRNRYVMKDFTNFASGFNYFCGDKFDIYLFIIDEKIIKASFYGSGCSVSTASASLLTNSLKDVFVCKYESLFLYFINIIKDKTCLCYDKEYLDFNTLANVRAYPTRVKCATLIWYTLLDALKINI